MLFKGASIECFLSASMPRSTKLQASKDKLENKHLLKNKYACLAVFPRSAYFIKLSTFFFW